MSFRQVLTFAALVIVATAAVGCGQPTASISPEEAKAIAQEAYIFAYPLILCYRAHYVGGIDTESPVYRAGYNEIVHDPRPADHTRHDVVTINADTPYSNFGLDLRAEPFVVRVPDVPDRYYVMQFADFYTHNFAYIGTRTTGEKAGNYLFVGPKWEGEIPEDTFDGVYRCETDTLSAVVRTQLLGGADLPNVGAVQKGYKIMSLSEFLGEEPKPALGVEDWPAWDQEKASSIGFIEYFNFILALAEPIHPQDLPALERFAKIGIGPGRTFDASSLDPEFRQAIEDGVGAATQKIIHKAENIGEQVNGWNMTDAFGSREFFQQDWLLRAAGAMAAIFANDKVEAFYPQVYIDSEGNTLDGSSGAYILGFDGGNLPPAKYFWSVTMYDKSYDGNAGYLVENPIDRYLINSTTDGLVYGADGSLTIFIQHEKPTGDKAANWLPAPAAPFYLTMRVYGPEEVALNGEWAPPAVQKVN